MARMRTGGSLDSRVGATRATLVLALAVAALALAGCSWRVETPEPALPSPDARELARDAAARAERDIVIALEAAVADGPGAAWLLTYELEASPAHLTALGGVYEPFPLESGAESPSPGASAQAPGATDYVTATTLAAQGALSKAVAEPDPTLALLFSSIALAHSTALAVADQLDAAAAFAATHPDPSPSPSPAVNDEPTRFPVIAERTPPAAAGLPFTLTPPTTMTLSPETVDAIIVEHDYASYVYDVIAARSTGAARDDAIERGEMHAERARLLVEAAGRDPRGPTYAITHASLVSEYARAALAAQVEAGVAERYMEAFAEDVDSDATAGTEPEPSQRAWLLASAYDALVASLLAYESAPEDLANFPGIRVS